MRRSGDLPGQRANLSGRCQAGECDVAETCTGTSTTCPADAFKPSATVCRPAAGVCDVAEHWTGTSNACPADGFKANTVVCRPAAGVCDVAEKCTGSSATCPVDGFASKTTSCDDNNACTTNDHCDGNGHCTGDPAPDVVLHLIKHVANHDSCSTSQCLNGLVASDFDLTVTVNSTSTIYAGVEASGTAINLKIGDTFAVTEDLTMQSASQPILNPGGVQGDISHFYMKRFSSSGCSGMATCNPTTGPQEQTCTVTNDDVLLQNQLGIITVTENPWTYMPAVCPGDQHNLPKVTTINGSFHLVNVSINQPHDVLVTDMSVLLEYRDENTGQLTTLVDPATCTFQLGGSGPKVTSFTLTTTQGVSFSCNVSSLPVTTAINCHDVVKATVRVHLFQRHTTFTSSYTRQILQ